MPQDPVQGASSPRKPFSRPFAQFSTAPLSGASTDIPCCDRLTPLQCPSQSSAEPHLPGPHTQSPQCPRPRASHPSSKRLPTSSKQRKTRSFPTLLWVKAQSSKADRPGFKSSLNEWQCTNYLISPSLFPGRENVLALIESEGGP